jgi:4-amino-4-deoxy-L-arabinose transferase-like glycosyltransferase
MLELVVGHNGFNRLIPGGLRGITGGNDDAAPRRPPPPPQADGQVAGQRPGLSPVAHPPPPPPGQGGPQQETGTPGPLRLFNRQLAGQISWFIPVALLGLVVAWPRRAGWDISRQRQSLLLWGGWLLTMVVFFSMASFFHRYYLEMLAPAIAALTAIGLVTHWDDYRHTSGWRGLLLPAMLVVAGLTQVVILWPFAGWNGWPAPLVLLISLAAAMVLLSLKLAGAVAGVSGAAAKAVLLFSGLLLLAGPFIWLAIPVVVGGDSGLPFAGPELLERQHQPGRELLVNDRLLTYLQTNQQGEAYLVATLNSHSAAALILPTGEPVMALGGFNGGDQILSTAALQGYVNRGEVRFFLLEGDRDGAQREVTGWVMDNCRVVEPALWRTGNRALPPLHTPAGARPPGPGGGEQQLYDCGGM